MSSNFPSPLMGEGAKDRSEAGEGSFSSDMSEVSPLTRLALLATLSRGRGRVL